MSRAHRRGPWVAEEDATLLSLVASRGPNNWVQISQHMHYRSPKQCRERYHQNLKSSLNHDPISGEEGEAIEEMVGDMGKKWAEIARRLGNRSDNAVKNWWNGSQNRKKRNVPYHGLSSKTLSNRTQPIHASRHHGSPPRPHGRRRSQEVDPSIPCSRPWQDLESAALGLRSLRSDRHHAAELAHTQVPSPPHGYDQQPSPRLPYPRQDSARWLSSPASYKSRPRHQVGPLLPSLGPIITNRAAQTNGPPLLQPPLSAASMDAAPSLVSDHNSTYSISPKTWPSPRPELPPIVDSSRRYWHDLRHDDHHRRGSAPAISTLLSLPSPGDEGYVSAITPSGFSSEQQKCLLPTSATGPNHPRPASLDEQASYHSRGHRHRLSNSNHSNMSLPPLLHEHDHSHHDTESSAGRDSRMKFSSLLN